MQNSKVYGLYVNGALLWMRVKEQSAMLTATPEVGDAPALSNNMPNLMMLTSDPQKMAMLFPAFGTVKVEILEVEIKVKEDQAP